LPGRIVTLSHPDFNRRPRNYTGSADLQTEVWSARGLSAYADLPPVGNFAPPWE